MLKLFFREGFHESKTLSLQRHASIVQQQNYCQKLLRLGKSREVVLRKVLGGGDCGIARSGTHPNM